MKVSPSVSAIAKLHLGHLTADLTTHSSLTLCRSRTPNIRTNFPHAEQSGPERESKYSNVCAQVKKYELEEIKRHMPAG